MPAAEALGMRGAYEITEKAYRMPQVSDTFHGRDIFAPVAAHLSLGVAPDAVGPPADGLVQMDFGDYEVTATSLTGRILFADRFGNLISNVPGDALPAWLGVGSRVRLEMEGDHEVLFVRSYGAVDPGTPAVALSSDGYLEIAVNRGSAAAALGAKAGTYFALRPR